MLTLGGSNARYCGFNADDDRIVASLSTKHDLPKPLRRDRFFLWRGGEPPEGFKAYVMLHRDEDRWPAQPGVLSVAIPDAYEYLADGDIVRFQPNRGALRVLYRRGSAFNALLLTERCNNYCLMCSQPPREIDDSWIVAEVLELLPLVPTDARELCLTGGEPTLLGSDLMRIVRACESWLPRTAVHILSNGRRFSDLSFARAYASVGHHDVMVGIPLYAEVSNIHDYVVQADGAFDETIRGILNLKLLNQQVELRVVLHAQTVGRLPQLARFISRNLPFVDHVALMGLEATGFAIANMSSLWIDPYDYKDQLRDAVDMLAGHRMNVSVYNHQLCVIDESIHAYARKSISDWKTEYVAECGSCTKRDQCGGFFATSRGKHSTHIRAYA